MGGDARPPQPQVADVKPGRRIPNAPKASSQSSPHQAKLSQGNTHVTRILVLLHSRGPPPPPLPHPRKCIFRGLAPPTGEGGGGSTSPAALRVLGLGGSGPVCLSYTANRHIAFGTAFASISHLDDFGGDFDSLRMEGKDVAGLLTYTWVLIAVSAILQGAMVPPLLRVLDLVPHHEEPERYGRGALLCTL